MAKGKYATALFEVMNRGKLPNSRHGPAASGDGPPTAITSRSPRWWFRSRNTPGESADPTSFNDSSSDTPQAPAAVRVPPLTSSIDVPESDPSAPAPRVQPVAVSVDSDKQQINLRLSYTSALIGGFSLFIALGLAVLIGKSLSKGPSTAIANTSTATLKQRPPTPGVLNVPRRNDVLGSNDTAEGYGARPANSTSTGTRAPQPTFNDPRPPATFFTDDPHRSGGLNYIIIQSYPEKEKQMAEQAAAFLTKNGIPCTVEHNLPNWSPWPNAYSVVGIRGFAKVYNNPDLETYKKSVTDVGAKFTNGRSGFKSFAPSPYCWRKSN
jgi:hypothetical protein